MGLRTFCVHGEVYKQSSWECEVVAKSRAALQKPAGASAVLNPSSADQRRPQVSTA